MDATDIFLSYSHRDGAAFAQALESLLRARGFTVFMDQIVLRAGDELEHSIFPRIRAATLYIPVITAGFCDPKCWAFKEYEIALAEAARRDNISTQTRFVYPILHNLSGATDPALNINERLREHLQATIYRLSTDLPQLVDEIVIRAGVNEDQFVGSEVLGVFGGRFPVTNVEYRRFINSKGYSNEGVDRWWSAAGREFWFSYVARVRHRYLWSIRTEDQVIDENLTGSNTRFNRFNQPVTGVSYFEAEAYCNWLSETLSPNRDWTFRLPTENEWLALLAPLSDRVPANLGNPGVANLLFEKKAELHHGIVDLAIAARTSYPSVFGAYPKSVSHAGCHDLIGNVWEWAHDFEDPKVAKETSGRSGNVGKILGNCCFDIPARVRFPPRELRFPGYRHHVIGFRVVKTRTRKCSE